MTHQAPEAVLVIHEQLWNNRKSLDLIYSLFCDMFLDIFFASRIEFYAATKLLCQEK